MPDRPPRVFVAGGIVLFRPDPVQLEALVAALVPQVSRLHVFANGPLTEGVRAMLDDMAPGAHLVISPDNLGIAAALNHLALAAGGEGATHLLVFDQDSRIEPDHAAKLSSAAIRLAAAGVRPAVVGPSPVPSGQADGHKTPTYRDRPGCVPVEGLRPVQFLATSGTLLDLAAWHAVGPFRADFFIDAVDTEWCFRAWHRGFSCWAEPALPMLHRVGDGTITLSWLGLEMPRQKPFRMETYLRNSVFSWRLPHVPLGWRLRQMAYLPVQACLYWATFGFAPAVLRRLFRGVGDGLAGRLGPPRGLS